MTSGTIVTVGMAQHAPYLRLSRRLLAAELDGWRWLLVDNSPDLSLRPLAAELAMEWVEGASAEALGEGERLASAHHGMGLALGIRRVDGRRLLVLDPDFLLVPQGALAQLLAAMEAGGYAALGTPWTPELHYKYRNGPCPHCLLVDLERVPLDALRFEPELTSPKNTAQRVQGALTGPLAWLRAALSPLHQLITGRLGIGSSCDTGYRFADWLARHHPERIGYLRAVAYGRGRFTHPWHMRHGWGRSLERMLPSRWSYLPPSRFYVETVASEFAEIDGLGLDAFLLNRRLFGLHVRRSRADFSGDGGEAGFVREVEALTAKLRAAPAAAIG